MSEQGLIAIKDLIQERKKERITEEEFQEKMLDLLTNDDVVFDKKRVIKCILKIMPFEVLELLEELV